MMARRLHITIILVFAIIIALISIGCSRSYINSPKSYIQVSKDISSTVKNQIPLDIVPYNISQVYAATRNILEKKHYVVRLFIKNNITRQYHHQDFYHWITKTTETQEVKGALVRNKANPLIFKKNKNLEIVYLYPQDLDRTEIRFAINGLKKEKSKDMHILTESAKTLKEEINAELLLFDSTDNAIDKK